MADRRERHNCPVAAVAVRKLRPAWAVAVHKDCFAVEVAVVVHKDYLAAVVVVVVRRGRLAYRAAVRMQAGKRLAQVVVVRKDFPAWVVAARKDFPVWVVAARKLCPAWAVVVRKLRLAWVAVRKERLAAAAVAAAHKRERHNCPAETDFPASKP